MTPFALIAAAGSLAVAPAPGFAPVDQAAIESTPIQTTAIATAFDIASSHGETSVLSYGPPPHAPAHGRRGRGHRHRDYDRGYRDDDRYYSRRDYRDDRIYDRRGRYVEPRRIRSRDRVWRGRDGNYYCERGNGTTGLVVGAGVGALLGRTIDTRGDRTVGTVLGAIAGGLLGREIDRGDIRCR